jgi:hypothetical protein
MMSQPNGRESDRICRRCKHFVDDPEKIEAELPGINALGSMFASVRGDSGLCRVNERFMHATDSCEEFAAR